MSVTRRISAGLCLAFLAWSMAASAGDLRVGAVDLARLVKQSPQAQRAKANMAKQFADRKHALEAQNKALQDDIDRLKNDSQSVKDRDKLQASIRDRQRTLQLRQGKYNDDVAAAEKREFDSMRDDIRNVIDAYARDHHYDLILGNSVLYASDSVDLTDEILAQLKKR